MIKQYITKLSARSRGFHIITQDVLRTINNGLPEQGILHVFIQHTSAGLCINENADPDVLHDFELFFNRLAPEHLAGMKHTIEGLDDMPAHIKAALVGHSIQVPIVNGRLALGTWQGIYLCEFRNHAAGRNLVVSVWT